MKKILKIGLMCVALSTLLNADENIKVKNVHEDLNDIKVGINKYSESEVSQNIDLSKLNSIIVENEKSNIIAINYITNIDGTINVEIDLLSNELNLTTIETLRAIIKGLKENKNINKIYIKK